MQEWQRKRSEKIADLVLGVHLLTYLLTVSFFILRLPRSPSYPSLIAVLLGFFLPATLFAWLDYHLLAGWRKRGQRPRLLLWNIAKVAFLFGIITYVQAFSEHFLLQQQGALYLVPVVLAAVTFGRPGGFISAGVSAVLLLLLSGGPSQIPSVSPLETVYLLTGIFFLLAWFLGGVMEVEKSTSLYLANLVNKDELTGLGNHRLFQERMQLLIDGALRHSTTFSLILLDIDDFKEYNYTYGHFQGDLVLKEVAALLQQSLPPGGQVARYGGDEFAVLLPGTELEEAVRLADALREGVARHQFFSEEGHPCEGVTVSAGVANFPYHAVSRKDLLEAADEALYSSKVTGSNKVRVYLGMLEKIRSRVGEEDRELVSSLRTLMTLVNAKDRYTYGHAERVAYYIRNFAAYLELSEEFSRLLEYGAFLHDIGKLETPREILNKRGPLTEGEWLIMQEHPRLGAEILRPIKFLQPIISMVLHHHENYDGSGYPAGLAGERIPYAARLLRIVDSFDAMKTRRPYHKPFSIEEILSELQKGSGRFYDPHLVEAFINMLRKKDGEINIVFSPYSF